MESDTLATFFAMGGYAAYVWTAFAATAIVLIGLVLASLRALKAREADLTRLRAEMGEAKGDLAGEA
jgi:heme exporter protein CcmD